MSSEPSPFVLGANLMSASENIDIDSLFAQTLIGDYDDDAPWEAVCLLRKVGSREVLEKAVSWCKSDNPLRRARGAGILAQLGKTAEHPENSFPEQSYSAVSLLLQRESEIQPMCSAIHALGHIGNASAISQISANASHPHEDVRFAVACALGNFPNDQIAVEVLIQLSRDPDSDVRDWATFGFGVQGDQDSPEIREALLERLYDPDEDASEEALVALSKRNDLRGLPKLLFLLDQPTSTVRVHEAAEMLLGIYPNEEDWSPYQYLEALRKRFPSA